MKYIEHGEYLVYRDGRIFSKARGRFLKPTLGKGKSKYLVVKIPNRIKVHRLVAMLFIPNPENKPEVNHKDGNKMNNHVSNLEWSTKQENMKHSYLNKLHNNSGENSGRSKLTAIDVSIIRDCIADNFKNVSIAKYFKVDPSTICDIKSGKSWSSL